MHRFVCTDDSNFVVMNLTDNRVDVLNDEQFKQLVTSGDICDVYYDDVLCKFVNINGAMYSRTELKRKGLYPLSYDVQSTTFIDLDTLAVTQRFAEEIELTVPIEELLYYDNAHSCLCLLTPKSTPRLFGYGLSFDDLKIDKYNAMSEMLDACLKIVATRIEDKQFDIIKSGYRETGDYVQPYFLLKVNVMSEAFKAFKAKAMQDAMIHNYVHNVLRLTNDYNEYKADFTDEAMTAIA